MKNYGVLTIVVKVAPQGAPTWEVELTLYTKDPRPAKPSGTER